MEFRGPRPGLLKLLAMRAKVAAPVSNGESLDGCTANGTRLAAAMSHAEVVMSRAQSSVRSYVRINAGAFTAYSRLQYIDNRPVKFLYLL